MRNALILLMICIFSLISNAQKVGVVLSGGGAKGMAHIGVLKALEENNIPIDYIAGTSIGAIVAGLYSIGYSPEEMETLFKSNEFSKWASGKIDDQYIYYFKEEEPNAAWITLDFAYDSIIRPKLPTNLVPPHQMDFAFMNLFSQGIAKADYNFDSLFIPFRCVAVDVHNNEVVVFRKGQLPAAIRSSMTVPLYFKPITVDGKLLFDGGLLNNFPMDVIIADFNPDVIIGSKVSYNSKKPDEDDLLLQIENMVCANTNFNIPKEKGVLIEPVVSDVGLMDFHRAEELIKNGYYEASYRIEEIKELVQRNVSRIDVEKKRNEFKADLPELTFKKIDIDGLTVRQKAYLRMKLRRRNRLLTIDQFKKSYFTLVSDDKISSIYPTAVYDKSSGFFDLYLKVKRQKKFKAEIGGDISSSPITQAYLGLKYHQLDKFAYTLSSNVYLGRLYTSMTVNGRIDFPYRLPFYTNASLTFNKWDYFRSYSGLFFDDIRPSYLIRYETNFKINAGFPLGKKSRIIFGGALADMTDNYYQVQNFIKADTADRTTFFLYNGQTTFERKTLDYGQYKNCGSYLSFEFRYINGLENHHPGSTSPTLYRQKHYHEWINLKFTYDKYFNSKGFFTPGVYFEGVYSTQNFFSNYTSSILMSPDFTPTPHSQTIFLNNFRAEKYISGGLKTVFNITKSLDLRIEGYAFLPYQKILIDNHFDAYHSNKWSHQFYMGSAALILHTPVGPASISVNYYDKEVQEYFFFFNFGYILFNKRGID
jgi:NTE family protein